MAQYYSSRPRRASSSRESRRTAETESWSDTLADTSIFFFPNPSSAPPSPSQISDLSIPTTELSSSAFSDVSYGDQSLAPSPLLLNSPRGRFDSETERAEVRLWEWPEDINSAVTSQAAFSEDIMTQNEPEARNARPSNDNSRFAELFPALWKIAARPGDHNLDMYPPHESTLPNQPSDRIHVPLLSFFASLLSVEESTLDLLTTSAVPSLFPGPIALGAHSPEFIDEKCERKHGIDRILLSFDESQPLFYGTEGTPLPPLSFHLSDVWTLFSGLFTSGGRVLRDALRA